MRYRAEELESKFDMPDSLRNIVEIPNEYGTSVYIGDARYFRFSGYDIYGDAILKRYDKKEAMETVLDWHLPFFKNRPTIKNKFIWIIENNFHRSLFILNGTPARSIYTTEGYRDSLKGNAANRGISLTDKLLDMVFGPIEDKLMEIYQKIANPEEND